MKKSLVFIFALAFLSCSKKEIAYPPVGSGVSQESEIDISKERAKNLNKVERTLIEEWIKNQEETFFTMPLNYWVNKENFKNRTKKQPEEKVSYMYLMYDFDGNQVYEKPKGFRDIPIGKINDIKVVGDALQYMEKGEEVTLLSPSVLAYGTSGDQDRIAHDIPLVIKLKTIE